MIDLSNIIAIALGADDVLQVQDSLGTVLWQKSYLVTITAGSNGSVSVNGVSGNYSQRVAAGTTLTIEGTGDAGYDFDEWSDGVSTNPRTITVTGDLTLSASFVQAVMLNYFYVQDVSGQPNTLSLIKHSNYAPTIEPYYSTDQQTWTSMGTTSTTPITATVPANGKLYIKCIADSWGYVQGVDQNKSWHTMSFTGNHNIGGNIMSLLYGDNFEGQTTISTQHSNTFSNLFESNTFLIDASDLLLPATTVSRDTYGNMFKGCTNLTAAPAILPATTLAQTGSYISMFEGCSSLGNAPVLMVEYIKAYDLYTMFKGCTLIDKIVTYANTVENNGTTNWLQNVAATGDFYALGSTNWTINSPSGVPVGWTLHHSLPVPCNVSISSNGNGSVSVNGVSGDYSDTVMSGTQLTLVATPDSGYVFDSWSDGDTNATRTVTITADTTLTASFVTAQPVGEPFYVEDASGSSNTVTILKRDANAPTIEVFKSTNGTNWTSMGNTSTSGITATVPANSKLYLKATTNGWRDSSGQSYDHNIDCSGNFKIGGHIASLLFGDNYSGATLTSTNNYAFEDLFSGDTHLTDASDLVLPDTTAASCYTGTFENCTNLTAAPALPATTLADSCYVRMFRSCTSVNEIICYADTLGTDSTYQWLAGVASSGDFYKLGSATFASGASGIPTNWTVHTNL